MNEELLNILACPACKKSLVESAQGLDCLSCKKRYPVQEGIPVLLIGEAHPLSS